MALERDPDWPGASDKDETEDPYIDRAEVRRIAGEMNELLKKIKDLSGIPVTEFAGPVGGEASEPELPTGAGSLADLQRYCALNEHQTGQWPAAMQYGFSAQMAYSTLVGEPGAGSGGLYAQLVARADEAFDEGLTEIARTSQRAESASEEAATQRDA
ncbi:hypothetical protein FE391_45250 [Nonomuraea sp. KC401]|uniref:hypothetical protein n=1 Tax=unclassified Nonomuraea TaxID=2593643 RepID=UPI0010FE3AE5|nr:MULTISPECIES: hypothetical protein [unclassified Nonomuraea]NBE99232.1 hypothetical protein [Nonomuraea sp. K271]TLF49606.1 hypothetical protein FE391_45250 [Nonomuraea sp. KC401]